MQTPLFERTELIRIGRILGALLVLFGGLALLLQSYVVDIVPPRDGFVETTATIIDLEQLGTFQDPSFMVTLLYEIPDENANFQEVRSGQRVEFEQYFELIEGQTVTIHYNPQENSLWRLELDSDKLSEFGLGFLMIIFGILSLSFPTLINWASRQEDFEFKDELETNETSGVNFY
ncbi:MAG: hypothetical protein Phog2KO_35550 [Phototrophicaceae bacterium]